MKLYTYEKPENMSYGDYLYEIIRYNIVNWNIKPGTRISEQEFSELLNVSRTPVRESFIRLSREGLLKVVPQKGTYVSLVDLKQIEESRFIRKHLEIAVIKLAIQKITKEQLKILEDNLTKQKVIAESDDVDYDSFYRLDEDFHYVIFDCVNKKMTWKQIDQNNTQYKRIRMLSYIDKVNVDKVITQHEKILHALETKNIDLAVEAMNEHLDKLNFDLPYMKSQHPEYYEK